jgi:O-acetyl-ADP-ribose deacetylase (regulator of RNase III)
LKVQVARGDITDEKVDAITNAANGSLQHAGGLAAAIVKKFGQ